MESENKQQRCWGEEARIQLKRKQWNKKTNTYWFHLEPHIELHVELQMKIHLGCWRLRLICWACRRIFHHDIFVTAGTGMTLEKAVQPDGSQAFSPTFGLSVGFRVFTGKDMAVRVQLRDDFVIQNRVKTADKQGTFLKQNVSLMVGFSKLGGK